VGTKVELISLGEPDKWTQLKPGTQGTVAFVDDANTVHVNWEGGSNLGLFPGVDRFKVIE
jgi:hypothetical protein